MVSKCKMYQHLLHLIHIPTFLVDSYFLNSIPTSVLFFTDSYQSYFLPVLLTGTLAYWVFQQHERFLSTNTCSFNLHLAYCSDHYYNIYFTNELKRSWLSRCTVCQGWYIQNMQYLKFVMFSSKSVEIDLNFKVFT